MSRYTHIKSNIEYAWGYDEPMQEYFIQAEDLLAKDEDNSTLWWIGSHTTVVPHPSYPTKMSWTNSEIIALVKTQQVPIPEEHVEAIAADLPF